MNVIIKPKGVIALCAIGATVVIGIIASQMASRSNANSVVPVGGLAKPGATPDVIDDAGEREEKAMLAEWNRVAEQERDWLFLGPLASGQAIKELSNTKEAQEQMDRIINTVYLPNEAKYQAKEGASFNLNGTTYAWKKVRGSAFDFKELYHTGGVRYENLQNMVVYGVTQIESAATAKKVIRIRSDDGAIVWLNGDRVYKNTRIRGVRTEEETIPVTLRPGANTILVKVGQGGGGWGLMFHVEDPKKK